MEEVIGGMEDWPSQTLFEMLREMLLWSVTVLPCTSASSEVSKPVGMSSPKSRPV